MVKRVVQKTNLSDSPLHFVRGFNDHIESGQKDAGDDWAPAVAGDPNIKLKFLKDGKIIKARYNYEHELGGFGWFIKHEIGYNDYLYYGHLKEGSMTVKVGDIVKKGQVLGIMGSSGWATGIHTHIGRKKNGVWIDVHNLIIDINMDAETQKHLWRKLVSEIPHISQTYNVSTVYTFWNNVAEPRLIIKLERLADQGDPVAIKALEGFETKNGKYEQTPLGWYLKDTHYKNIWYKSFLPK